MLTKAEITFIVDAIFSNSLSMEDLERTILEEMITMNKNSYEEGYKEGYNEGYDIGFDTGTDGKKVYR